MLVSPLTPEDIPEVMRLERLPGYDAYIGRYAADEHAENLAASDVRYFGLRDGQRLVGFVILFDLHAPSAHLRRIAVEAVERGAGTRLLRAAMDWVFERTTAEALTLDLALGNERARHVYEREGFETYGTDEVHHLMSIPRARWAELRAAAL